VVLPEFVGMVDVWDRADCVFLEICVFTDRKSGRVVGGKILVFRFPGKGWMPPCCWWTLLFMGRKRWFSS